METGISALGGLGMTQIVNRIDIAQAVGDQIGNMELAGGGAALQGIDTHISEGLCIGHSSTAAGV
jgi:hypothetical protein